MRITGSHRRRASWRHFTRSLALFRYASACFLSFLLLTTAVLGAQTATITGQVIDSTGAPIAAVTIRIEPVSGGAARTVRTAEDGRFTLPAPAAGPYLVLVAHEGHADWKEVVEV